MALALIIIGLVLMFLVNWTLGLILLIIGVILLFVPAVPYGYSSWRR